MKHVFIVNPVSGKADASLYLVPRLIDAAAGAGVDYAVELTQHAGHAAEIARQYHLQEATVRMRYVRLRREIVRIAASVAEENFSY